MDTIDKQLQEQLSESLDSLVFNRQDEVLHQISQLPRKRFFRKSYPVFASLLRAAAMVLIISSISLASISLVIPVEKKYQKEEIIVSGPYSFAAVQHQEVWYSGDSNR